MMEVWQEGDFTVPLHWWGWLSESTGGFIPTNWWIFNFLDFDPDIINGVKYTTYDEAYLKSKIDDFDFIRSYRCTCKKTETRNKVCAIPTEVEKLDNWMEKLPHEIRERPITMIAMPGSHDAASAELDGKVYDDTLAGLHLSQNSITVNGIINLIRAMSNACEGKEGDELEECQTAWKSDNPYGLKDIADCLIHNYPSCRETFLTFVKTPVSSETSLNLVLLPLLGNFLAAELGNPDNDDETFAAINNAITFVRDLVFDGLGFREIAEQVIVNVARTQDLTIIQQLENGIRYFDMRLMPHLYKDGYPIHFAHFIYDKKSFDHHMWELNNFLE